MATSRERQGVLGKYTEHFDENGKKTGESHEREGFFGKYTEHTDAEGHKIGESRERDGFIGKYTEHTDAEGKKTGESRERDGFFGKYTEHVDAHGKKTGESRERSGFFGDYIEHTGTGWRGTPSAKESKKKFKPSRFSSSGTAVQNNPHWGVILLIGAAVALIVYLFNIPSPNSGFNVDQQAASDIQDGVNLISSCNKLLKEHYNQDFHVARDAEMGWTKYYLDYLRKQRAKWSYYPYIVNGDFDGDGRKDIAIFALSSRNKFDRRLVIFNSRDWSHPYDLGDIADGIQLFPQTDIHSYPQVSSLNMKHDGVLEFKFESTAVMYFWDGARYVQVVLGD